MSKILRKLYKFGILIIFLFLKPTFSTKTSLNTLYLFQRKYYLSSTFNKENMQLKIIFYNLTNILNLQTTGGVWVWIKFIPKCSLNILSRLAGLGWQPTRFNSYTLNGSNIQEKWFEYFSLTRTPPAQTRIKDKLDEELCWDEES